jgi:hypothetical protein
MDRRSFIKKSEALGLLPFLPTNFDLWGRRIAPHNWDGHDFGPPPAITDRLDQGPFSSYGADATAPGSDIVMATSPSSAPISNYGMGMVTYLCDEVGPPKAPKGKLYEALEALVKYDLGDKLYLRVDWRDIQRQQGRLHFPEHWNMAFDLAGQYDKRIGIRIQLMSPVIAPHSVPDFLQDKIPFVKLGTTDEIGIPGKVHYAPRYDDPHFIAAFKELDDLLSAQYNGHELIEYVDTYMYGFWGEGHSWPFEGNPFPDYATAEATSILMFEHQANNWTKTPLVTNTQPDYNDVGNSEVLDRTIRSHNWLRTDTIFIEPEQIDALSNRPPWIGATIENGFSNGRPESLRLIDGTPRTEMIIQHIKDVGPNYCSLWNWHDLSADNLKRYFDQYPTAIDGLRRCIGYRVRPSWVWFCADEERPYLILGMVNDGIAGVPGALRIYLGDRDKTFETGGSLDPGYPLPGKVRQVKIPVPKNTDWQGLRLRAELEVKGQRYPVRWACDKYLNADGSLTLTKNL